VGEPDKIPLKDAVERDLIPCSACGATGASVQQVEGKKHFLCYPCSVLARRRRGAALGLLVVALAAAAFLAVRIGSRPAGGPGEPPPEVARELERLRKAADEADGLMRQGRLKEAREFLTNEVRQTPGIPILNQLLGRCLDRLGYSEAGIPLWHALTQDPRTAPEGIVLLGKAYVQLGHASEALKYLEKPLPDPGLEEGRRLHLLECLLDLERFEDVVRDTPEKPPTMDLVRLRFRALSHLGRKEEAEKLLAGLDADARSNPALRGRLAQLRTIERREAGDFPAALKIAADVLPGLDGGSSEAVMLRRSLLAVHFEAGDFERLEADARALADSPSPQVLGEAVWYRALGRLATGRKDEAKAIAKEALDKCDRELAILRPRLIMLTHLAGQRKDEDVEREAKAVHRFYANEYYYYLALATGDRKWAERAAEATPGRDFPHHSIQRLLLKK
jgi:tetratricopeptide (TPR) repeat protein